MTQISSLFGSITPGVSGQTANVGQLAQAFAKRAQTGPIDVRVVTSGLILGASDFMLNQAVAGLFTAWGIGSFAVQTVSDQDGEAMDALAALFLAVVAEDKRAACIALGNSKVFGCDALTNGETEQEASTVVYFKELFEEMKGENPNWDLYCAKREIKMVDEVCACPDDSKEVVADASLRKKYNAILDRINNGRIDLFVYDPRTQGGSEAGWQMKRLLIKLVLGIKKDIGYQIIVDVAKKVDITVHFEDNPGKKWKKIVVPDDAEERVLCYIKRECFNRGNKKLKLKFKNTILRRTTIEGMDRAIEELESTLAAL